MKASFATLQKGWPDFTPVSKGMGRVGEILKTRMYAIKREMRRALALPSGEGTSTAFALFPRGRGQGERSALLHATLVVV
jgi:hypothetical protein